MTAEEQVTHDWEYTEDFEEEEEEDSEEGGVNLTISTTRQYSQRY